LFLQNKEKLYVIYLFLKNSFIEGMRKRNLNNLKKGVTNSNECNRKVIINIHLLIW